MTERNRVLADKDLARIIHEANRAYNVALKDPAPDAPFDVLPDWHQEMITARVRLIREGYGPETIHDVWVDTMTARGWQLGDVKNPAGSPPTHPCLRDWRELPPEQQVKDTQAIAIVKNHLR